MRSKQQGAVQLIVLGIFIAFIAGNVLLDEYDAYKERQLQDKITQSIMKDYG